MSVRTVTGLNGQGARAVAAPFPSPPAISLPPPPPQAVRSSKSELENTQRRKIWCTKLSRYYMYAKTLLAGGGLSFSVVFLPIRFVLWWW